MCTVSALQELIGKALSLNMDGYQLYNLGHPVDEKSGQGIEMQLKDYSIEPGSTLIITKKGLVLSVTDAKVSYLRRL